jgi:hypothetical protein
MQLWSIQTADVWEEYLSPGSIGEYQAEWHKIDIINDLGFAYRWMTDRMEERGIALEGYAPIWAWHTWRPERPKPDLRSSGHLMAGSYGVLMTLDVPDRLALLSDFETWHFVLNKDFLSYNEHEANQPYTPEQMQESWKRVFELGKGDPEWLGSPQRAVQATLPRIERDWIESYKFFRGR